MKGCTCFIHEEVHTHHICNGYQLYAFKGWEVDLEVEGMHYIEMHRWAQVCSLFHLEIDSTDGKILFLRNKGFCF